MLGDLQQLDGLKTAGPGKTHPLIVKPLARLFPKTFTQIFNSSLDEGQIPEQWFTLNVMLVHKCGDRWL